MRLPRPLLALAVAAAIAVLSPTVPAASAAGRGGGAAVPTDAGGVALTVVPGSNGVIVPGADLTLQLRIENTGETAVPAGAANVFVARSAVDDRVELSTWLLADDPDAPTGTPVGTVETPEVLPGRSIALPTVTVAAASVPALSAREFAVHQLAVSLSADTIDPVTVRSAVTVDPGTGTPTTPVAVAVPLTVPPATTGIIPSALLQTYTEDGGLLSRELDQAVGLPVALAIDPRIIASINLLGDSAPASAIAWLDRLRSAPNETFALAYADGDIAATSQAGLGVLQPTSFVVDPDLFPTEVDTEPSAGPTAVDPSASGQPDPTVPGASVPTLDTLLAWSYSLPPIAWPRDDTVVAADLDIFAAAGLPTTILSSTNTSAGADVDAPPASAVAGTHQVLTSDATLSVLLRDAVTAPETILWQQALSRLTAALAVSAEGPAASGRVLLATLDRDLPAAGVDYRLASTLTTVQALPWTTSAAMSTAIAQSPEPVSVVDEPVAADRISTIGQLAASESSVAGFATVLTDPTLLTGQRRLGFIALTAQGWAVPGATDGATADGSTADGTTDSTDDSAQAATWAEAVAAYLTRSIEILGSVQVASTTLVQTSDSGALPIVVTNALDYPVTVTVNVVASSAILDVRTPSVPIEIAANSQRRALVEAASIANGEVTLTISLLSSAGVPLSVPSTVDVTVNAGWETAATTVLAVLVFAVFVLGIIRTVRRRRRIARGELTDDRAGDVLDVNDEESAVEASARGDSAGDGAVEASAVEKDSADQNESAGREHPAARNEPLDTGRRPSADADGGIR